MENIEQLLLPQNEFLKGGFAAPYTYKIEVERKALFYFGDSHSFDVNNPDFDQLISLWNEFLLLDSSKKFVFVEGGNIGVYESKNHAIFEGGASGLVSFLAQQKGISIESPEIKRKELDSILSKNFSTEELEYYYFARYVYQWNNFSDPKPDFEKYINSFFTSEKQESAVHNFDFTLKNMEKIHETLFSSSFDHTDSEFFYSIINPYSTKSLINSIAKDVSRKRDVYIVSEILKKWNSGFSLFVVFGSGHAIVQKPALEALLK